jgi:pimeloyl-ACP methyl ester carboxylesterase
MEKYKVSKSGIPYLHFGSGEPLVLIHGLGEEKEGWENQYELADQYELIIPDLGGHGSCNKSDGISIQNFAADVIELLKELGIESAHIAGFSMGGVVAQEIYRHAPDLCRSLLLISTFHFCPKILRKKIYKSKKAKFEKLLSTGGQGEYAAKLALYSWREENINNFTKSFQPKPQIFLTSLKACLNVDNTSLLPKVSVPTLIIGGQYDSILPVQLQLWIHKLIPHSEFTILRNTGHITKLEAKDRFNYHVRNFLNRQKLVV